MIETKRNHAQDNQCGDQIVESEYLAGVDDEIAQSFSGGEKFTDDDTYQTEADIDFQDTDHGRQAGGTDHMSQYLQPITAQGIDQFHGVRIGFAESGIHADDASEDGHGHTCHNDGLHVGTQPYDEKWSQGGFWETV